VSNYARYVESYRAHRRAQIGTTAERCRNRLRNAVYRHRLVKPTYCQSCGVEPGTPRLLHAHHWATYQAPFAVYFLCPKCHVKIERMN
jgi:hypothetical protein